MQLIRLLLIFVFLLLLPNQVQGDTLDDIQKARENGELDLADNTAKKLLTTAQNAGNLESEADALYQLARGDSRPQNSASSKLKTLGCCFLKKTKLT